MIVLGVGGHAKVVIDAIRQSGKKVSYILDDDEEKHGNTLMGYEVKGGISPDLNTAAIIGIGVNQIRQNIDRKVKHCQWESVIHPSAIIGTDVEIGEGTVVMAGAVIQPGTKIGRHVIINTGACIDHDCHIGDFVHIAPNCSLAGEIQVGEGAFIGIGSSVIQCKSIGAWTTVGAGSTVINEIPANCTAVGSPAKPVKFHQEQSD